MEKISCLMLTKYGLDLFGKAVQSFSRQTYPNKELVVVFEMSQPETFEKIDILRGVKNTKCVLVEDNLGRGTLRNASVENATGDVVVQWDDDEVNHPLRLETQYQKMVSENAFACYLEDRLHYFYPLKQLYWECGAYSTLDGKGKQHCPGTLMIRNNAEYRYVDEYWAEDVEIMHRVIPNEKVVTLPDHGHLYVYTFHGDNVVPLDHHKNIANRTTYSKQHIEEHESDLQKWLSELSIDDSFDVVCNDGVVKTFPEMPAHMLQL
jgi:glycosyltransferase involved in cell wall biosynthesis